MGLAKGWRLIAGGLFAGIRRHLLDHGQHQLAVAVVQIGGVAADLAEEADFIFGKLWQPFRAVTVTRFREELRQRQFHRSSDFGKRVEGGDGVSIFYARQVATQKSRALFDIALGHAFLQPVVADGLADIHRWKHCRMGNGNQSGTFWQVEICAIRWTSVPCGKYREITRAAGHGRSELDVV